MGIISSIFNFNNIGQKIKSFAKWSCWITILLIWIAAAICFLILIANEYTAWLSWIPLAAAVVLPFLVWVNSWVLYALGEFVEDTHAIRNREGTTTEAAAKREAEKQARLAAEEGTRRMAEEEEKLSIADFEEAASAFLNRKVSISDISCNLIYVISKSTGKPIEMHLDMTVGQQAFSSLDLFFDDESSAYCYKGRLLALDDDWRSVEEIFGFDINLFADFHFITDEDD